MRLRAVTWADAKVNETSIYDLGADENWFRRFSAPLRKRLAYKPGGFFPAAEKTCQARSAMAFFLKQRKYSL